MPGKLPPGGAVVAKRDNKLRPLSSRIRRSEIHRDLD